MGTVIAGWALVMQGQAAEGLALIHQGIALWRTTGMVLGQRDLQAMLVDAYAAVDQVEAGLQVLAEELAAPHAERGWEAELYRLQGELRWRQTPPAVSQVETDFHHALTLARQQQAKSLELRAAMSLSRLWQQQGKGHEARGLLTEVYDGFTEGFDTADLCDAQALLEALP